MLAIGRGISSEAKKIVLDTDCVETFIVGEPIALLFSQDFTKIVGNSPILVVLEATSEGPFALAQDLLFVNHVGRVTTKRFVALMCWTLTIPVEGDVRLASPALAAILETEDIVLICLSFGSAFISIFNPTVVFWNSSFTYVGKAANEFEVTSHGEGSDLSNFCAFFHCCPES